MVESTEWIRPTVNASNHIFGNSAEACAIPDRGNHKFVGMGTAHDGMLHNMGLFDFLRKNQAPAKQASASVPLEQTCYDVAYFILPQYVFQDLAKITDICLNTPATAGPFFYLMACQSREIDPDLDAATTLKWHPGLFDDNRRYLALEYPTPPPLDMGEADPIAMLESGNQIVLAPYYSVILYGDNIESEYFILGQAPIGGGTTLRQILDDGTNCNLGPGPPPSLNGCFAAIRERDSEREN